MHAASPAPACKQLPAHTTAAATTQKQAGSVALEQAYSSTYDLGSAWRRVADTSGTLEKTHVTQKQRARMVDWMFEVSSTLSEGDVEAAVSVFFHAVLIMDLFFKHCAHRTLTDTDVHLLGLACLFIANKYGDFRLKLRVFSDLAGHRMFSRGQICDTEAEVLQTLGFNLSFATPFDVLRGLVAEGRRRAALGASGGRRLVFEEACEDSGDEGLRGAKPGAVSADDVRALLTALEPLIAEDIFALSAHSLMLTMHHSQFNDFSPVHRVLACVARAIKCVFRLCLRLPGLRRVDKCLAEGLFRAEPFVAFLLAEAEGHLHSRHLLPRVERFIAAFGKNGWRVFVQVRRRSAYAPANLRLAALR